MINCAVYALLILINVEYVTVVLECTFEFNVIAVCFVIAENCWEVDTLFVVVSGSVFVFLVETITFTLD